MKLFYTAATLAFSLTLIGCAHDAEHSAVVTDVTLNKAATYRQRLDQDPSDIDARLEYATALSWFGEYTAAEQQFSTLLAQQPDNVDAITGLGYAYVWSDRYVLAEQQFKIALGHAPDHFDVQMGLALTYLQSGRCSEALDTLEMLKLRHPHEAEILAAIELAELGLMNHEQ